MGPICMDSDLGIANFATYVTIITRIRNPTEMTPFLMEDIVVRTPDRKVSYN